MVAVTTTVCAEAFAAAVAAKVVELELAGTSTDAGTVIAVLLAEMLTVLPDEGAGWESVTVQVEEALGASEVGEHAKEVRVIGASSEIVADLEEPLREAVRVAV